LDYLNSIGVDPKSQIKLVVATHWHDDHIKGMAQLFEEAASSTFVDSTAASMFNQLVNVVMLSTKLTARTSALREFDGILTILEGRRSNGQTRESVGPCHAVANRKLFSREHPSRSVDCEVFSLSPTDGVINRAIAELSNALVDVKEGRRPSVQGPNQLSVVLWLRVGATRVLLGADLEHVSGSTEGWQAIVTSKERPDGLAQCFKISHHGSNNADCPQCWTHLLSEGPVGILTPHAPSRLPRPSDISRLCAKTPEVFLTSDPTTYSIPRRENAVDRTLRDVARNRRAIAGQMGHVRMRCDARTPGQTPVIELRNGAKRVCATVENATAPH
jgi:hypothetical protein